MSHKTFVHLVKLVRVQQTWTILFRDVKPLGSCDSHIWISIVLKYGVSIPCFANNALNMNSSWFKPLWRLKFYQAQLFFFVPLVKAGICSSVLYRFTESPTLNPRLANITSPGLRLFKNPHCSVTCLSDVRPPHPLDMKETALRRNVYS